MIKEKLVLSTQSKNEEFVFNEKLNFVNDKKLVKVLSTENIHNNYSDFYIKSLNNTHISDVIQIKINLTNVGTFFANFRKDKFDEKQRNSLLDKFQTLKSDNKDLTVKTQEHKAAKILTILNKFKPIFVSFKNSLEIKINIKKISKENEWSYPLIVLNKTEKEILKDEKRIKNGITIDGEQFFAAVFSILFSFAIVTGCHELMNNQTIYIFLLLLAVVFAGILAYIYYSVCKIGTNKKVNLIMLLFSLAGSLIGCAGGTVVSKFVLTGDEITFDITKLLLIGCSISILVPPIILAIVLLIYKRKQAR